MTMRKLFKTKNSIPASHTSNIVEITESAFRGIMDTIGRHAPERFGILGGSLDNPFRITDFRYCPPRRSHDGRYDHGIAHVNVDAAYMNFVIDEEWRPNGKYLIGIIHSHPGSMQTLSSGDEARNEGDLVFFKNCLRHDDSPDQNWRYLIAPIVTFNSVGMPDVHVWIVTLDDPRPHLAKLVVLPNDSEQSQAGTPDLGLPLQAIMSRADAYQRLIVTTGTQVEIDAVDRDSTATMLRQLRKREFEDIVSGVHPLGRYLDISG